MRSRWEGLLWLFDGYFSFDWSLLGSGKFGGFSTVRRCSYPQILGRSMDVITIKGLFLRNPLKIRQQGQLKHTNTFCLIDVHTLHNDLFYLSGQLRSQLALADRNGKALLQFSFGFAVWERSLAMQKFVDEHPECPNVSFRAIDVMNEALGRHVNRRADVDVLELFSK